MFCTYIYVLPIFILHKKMLSCFEKRIYPAYFPRMIQIYINREAMCSSKTNIQTLQYTENLFVVKSVWG